MNESGIRDAFEKNFADRGELGASLSIWKDGAEVFSLHEGWRDRDKTIPWNADTIAPVWSATKGPAAIAFLTALHRAGILFHSPVSAVWPELTAARESGLTFAELVSHQSGLAATDKNARPDILSYRAVRSALEEQEPFWSPGKGHGYHPRTIGFLLDEVVRRVSGGISLGTFWNEEIARRLRIDFWIGELPATVVPRIATMVPPKIQRPSEAEIPFYRALGEPDSLALAAFSSPGGMRALSDINKLEYLNAGLPALGGVGSAAALAQFYQMLGSEGMWEGVRIVPKAVIDIAMTTQTKGDDKTLMLPTAFTAGFMRDPLDDEGKKLRTIFGSEVRAFGQPGAGGSHAFLDPESGYSFAYVMNQMEAGVLPNRKALDLVDALFG